MWEEMALPTRKDRQRFAVSQWTARAVPIVLTGVAGYATYVLVVILCVNYLLVKQHNKIAAIPILVTYFVLFILMATSFFRTLYITIFDPPYNALGPIPNTLSPGEADGQTNGADGLGGQKYSSGSTARLTPQKDLENPGLEEFYTKDVFRCEPDGAPRWCSTCRNWKKDRTSHCGDIGRCIDKMDHFCPWVGGPIGENNFKFFLQFTTYTALYCTELLVVMAVYIHRQRIDESETVNNQFIAILALAAFFGLFTAGMSITSIGLALRNTTQVETLGMKTKVHTFAVLVPPEEDRIRANPDLASEISFRTVTYPLSATPPAQFNQIPRCIDGTPVSRSNEYLQYVRQSQPIPVAEHERILRRDPSVVNMLIPRDQNAIRTFAILSTETGENPWFLGSPFLNLQALLGTNVLDWLLPIRRSPCCSHEDPESYYAIGPVIDRLRARAGFIAAEDVRPKRPHPRTVKRPREWRNGEDSHRPKGATEMDQLRENVNGHNGRAT